ncbi:MAG TPA: hypothetical protein VF899_11340 [Pyrinomonadaceae bacterium]
MMTTLQLLAEKPSIHTTTAWYLADLGEARGKQELFTKQSPQRLKVLREHALIESAVSSNRIEGVTVEQSRVEAVVSGKSPLRDTDEQEVRGYLNALKLIHQEGARLAVSEETILRLHRLSRANNGDAGQYKQNDSEIIEKYPDVVCECASKQLARERHLGKWLSWSKPGSIVSKKIGFTL